MLRAAETAARLGPTTHICLAERLRDALALARSWSALATCDSITAISLHTRPKTMPRGTGKGRGRREGAWDEKRNIPLQFHNCTIPETESTLGNVHEQIRAPRSILGSDVPHLVQTLSQRVQVPLFTPHPPPSLYLCCPRFHFLFC